MSYINKGHSWSWDDRRDDEGNPIWSYEQKSKDYTDERRTTSAGTGYILDFGSADLNKRFYGELLDAYKGTGEYALTTNNCGHAFQRAVNVIAEELGFPKNNSTIPGNHQKYIKSVLQPRGFVVGTVAYPKITVKEGAGKANGPKEASGRRP